MGHSVILLVLLFLSGLFSGSETALTSLSMARVEGLLKEGRHGARALFKLKSDPTPMLITLLIGNNLVNIAASALATVIAIDWFGNLGPGIAVGVLTLIILIFGEVTPKSLAIRYAERISLAVAPLMLALRRLLAPLVWLLELFTDRIHRYTGAQHDPTVTESELISMVAHGVQEGAIENGERVFIERVLAFNDLQVGDVMTPRPRIFALDGDRSVRDVLADVVAESYTRIPVYQEHPDQIRALVYLRDILAALGNGNEDLPLRDIAHEPLFAPLNQPIDELFATLRRARQHLAVVVDEYGDVQGLVTMEDLLEELVGEIYDETDETPQDINELEPGRVAVSGTMEIRVLQDFFDFELVGKPTDTISLWILNRIERIPQAGERLAIDGLQVEIEKASRRRIQQVVITRPNGSDA